MKETREQIDELLAQLEKPMREPDDASDQPSQEPQRPGYRFIDVHIYDYEEQAGEEEAATVEGTIGEAGPSQSTEPEQQASTPLAAQASKRYKKPLLLTLVLLSLLLFEAVIGLSAFPVTPPGATIMITLTSKDIETQTSIIIAEAGAGTQGAVRGRRLVITMQEQQAVKTTGTAKQPATNASGVITFYNAAPYTQMIAAGTLISGAEGMQIVTEQDAFIPAAVYPQFGEASVSAHAASPGEAGNQEAGAIYGPCCRLNISAVSRAFIGGADERTYPTATKQDIEGAAEQMKHRLERSIAAALDAQLTDEEEMLAPNCTQTTRTDKEPGEEAAAIQITQEATCTATAYNRREYQQAITKHLDQQAYTELGEGYRLRGTPEQEIIKASPKEQALTLLVTLRGTYLYQFSQEEQEQIKDKVKGKSIEEASEALRSTRGVEAVTISITNHAAALPTDSTSLSLVFVVS